MPTNREKRNKKGVNHHYNILEPRQDKRLIIFLNHDKCREWYTARPELIHYDLNVFREIQIETGERWAWGFDLTTDEGYNAALDRIHYLTFNRN